MSDKFCPYMCIGQDSSSPPHYTYNGNYCPEGGSPKPGVVTISTQVQTGQNCDNCPGPIRNLVIDARPLAVKGPAADRERAAAPKPDAAAGPAADRERAAAPKPDAAAGPAADPKRAGVQLYYRKGAYNPQPGHRCKDEFSVDNPDRMFIQSEIRAATHDGSEFRLFTVVTLAPTPPQIYRFAWAIDPRCTEMPAQHLALEDLTEYAFLVSSPSGQDVIEIRKSGGRAEVYYIV